MRGHTASGCGRGENSLKLFRVHGGGGVTVGVGILLVRRVPDAVEGAWVCCCHSVGQVLAVTSSNKGSGPLKGIQSRDT
jgi:hypothetical protein